ncbi:MAG: 50S ribosomal protein L15 [Candidatus Doudnabacteria bacterium RIFCSPLOWO2_01_FULL_44_21]|uniref:Large ribosomal subunit protein uL15 n=1 Tax=Candidatus Doudnabacteria bacterium RIFCSPLOWO2_01_FULL_44_21 TaxID=1817841 RepID=A0A1F5PXX2_9BACT|nr:ribosomal protein L15 [uncultured bacterium]OGE83563.1 MAG: 50S ribosomal protein L15 [Candidatus Doudnabacteria bacterium RIFCSPHIGHO2_02_FULL_43_13b]OGE94791.1 MAG: 50S ribosomal protein L15 [Candidatus Doudnabacteria bacterium RIFCSPLOWO2_01_FULL_44_21]
MLKLHELKPYKGSTKKRKVVGRGVGSGHGTFSGRGAKGQKARSGSSMPLGFEGGRMPLHRQIPKKRGFKSRQPKSIVINLERLDRKFKTGETVNPKILLAKGLIKSTTEPIKILGAGKINMVLTFEKVMISNSAKEKIIAAGGKII